MSPKRWQARVVMGAFPCVLWWLGGGVGGRAHLVEACHAIVIHQPGVGAVGQQEAGDVRVTAVAGPMQRSGTPMGLCITLGTALQQELAHGVVPVATGIVLQGRGRQVTQRKPGGHLGGAGERPLHWLQGRGRALSL